MIFGMTTVTSCELIHKDEALGDIICIGRIQARSAFEVLLARTKQDS
jgi:hypothetical protein